MSVGISAQAETSPSFTVSLLVAKPKNGLRSIKLKYFVIHWRNFSLEKWLLLAEQQLASTSSCPGDKLLFTLQFKFFLLQSGIF